MSHGKIILQMKQRFVFLEHTADAKFKAFGGTLEEAFANAAMATTSLMWNAEAIQKKVNHPIKIKGRDIEQLLLHFLEEIIYLRETKSFLLASVEEMRIKKEKGGFSLEAVFTGDLYSEKKYKLFGEVKAITYNEMVIDKSDSITVQVVVDI